MPMLTALILFADVTLQLRPELGDSAIYLVTRDWTFPAEESERLTWKDEFQLTVRQKSSTGQITLETKVTQKELFLDGKVFQSTQSDPWTFRETRNSLGMLIARSEDSLDASLMQRYSQALSIIFPKEAVKVGASWSAKKPADSESGEDAWKFDFAWVKTEKVKERKMATLNVKLSEDRAKTGIFASGTVRIDLASGILFDGTYDFERAPVPGDEESADARMKMTFENKAFTSSAKIAE